MSDPTPRAGAPRRRAGWPALVLVGLALSSAPALAWPEDVGFAPPRPRPRRVAGPVPPPVMPSALPRAAIVSGYLPRNNNVPMYNEPPGLGARGGPGW